MIFLYLLCSLFLTVSCQKKGAEPPTLMSVNIVDNHGLSEIVTTKERLQKLEGVDFLSNLPYKKVMRIYSRDGLGDMKAYVTTYWPNGQPKQYLEVLNGRAYGPFYEWYESGKIKASAFVIGGEGDTSESAVKTFLFDGESLVYNESGTPSAKITYSMGKLHGDSLYYHANSLPWKKIPYVDGKIEGLYQIFLQDGTLLLEAMYQDDEPSGYFRKYWDGSRLAMEEFWSKGRLIDGQYWTQEGILLPTLCQGMGERITFGKNGIHQKQHFEGGVPFGRVETYSEEGKMSSIHHIQGGMKEGEEIYYYSTSPSKPALLVNWSKNQIQGTVKSWYPTGVIESQKEMSLNKKNGLLSAWYRDGSLMMIEEYQEDRLVKGDYFQKGESRPISVVKNGKGRTTLFDGDGRFLRKIDYENGFPLSD